MNLNYDLLQLYQQIHFICGYSSMATCIFKEIIIKLEFWYADIIITIFNGMFGLNVEYQSNIVAYDCLSD